MALPIGSQAPDFTLKTLTAEGPADYTLSSNFGQKPVVLLFFPLAFTGVCTQEMCDVSAGLEKYNGLNAEVVAVSVDSPFAQQAWAEKEGIKVKLLSDLNKKTAHAYGVLLDDLLGFGSTAARAAFVIDKAGLIVHSEQTATPKDLPDFNKIAEALSNL
jgi:glutaredoxin-dependent peroxiredoxin